MDKLKQCAMSFQNLFNIEYRLILGKKGRTTCLVINFNEFDFHHLIGLHKLKDIGSVNRARDKVFEDIISDDDCITYEEISKSQFFDKDFDKGVPVSVRDRIEAFLKFNQVIDSDNLCFKYNNNTKYSNIRAEYVLKADVNGVIYTFLDKRDDNEFRYFKSFFPEDERDYTDGQASMTILYKEKLNKSSYEHIIQLDKLHRKFKAFKYLRKKKVCLCLRYSTIEVTAKSEEKAKEKLAQILAEYYSKYCEGIDIGDDMKYLIEKHQNILCEDYTKIINNIIII